MRLASFFLVMIVGVSARGQDLHAILIADTNDGQIGPSVQVDLNNVKKTLSEGLPVGRLHVTEVQGGDVSKDHVLQLISELAIEPDDSVLVYYSGHGGFDINDGHKIYLSNGESMLRSDMIDSITQPYTPKFWALVTDCCSNIPKSQQGLGCGKASSTILLEELFLNSRGRIDITSARPQQVAYGSDANGGTFTLALCQVFTSNANVKMTWNEVFAETRELTALASESTLSTTDQPYKHRDIPQRTQTPYSFKTMRGVNVNGKRLGISHSDLVISNVDAGSPADRAGLRVGMKIEFVNGLAVRDDEHLMTAVNFSRQNCQIRVAGRLDFFEPELSF